MAANDPYCRIADCGWVPGAVDALAGPALGVVGAGEGAGSADPVFTPALKLRFLDELSRHGNVRVAAGRVGVSRSGVYLARRRDELFADGWRTALCLARDHAEAVLAERALEGVEEPVFYHGEVIAVRRRFDTRLLLAHLARLDALCGEEAAARPNSDEGDLVRGFDRELAQIGDLPEGWDLPKAASREDARAQARWAAERNGPNRKKAEAAMEAAEDAWDANEAALHDAVDAAVRGDGAPEEAEALEEEELEEAGARVEGALEFKSIGAGDANLVAACACGPADRNPGFWTLSTVSTVPGARFAPNVVRRSGQSLGRSAVVGPGGGVRSEPGTAPSVAGGEYDAIEKRRFSPMVWCAKRRCAGTDAGAGRTGAGPERSRSRGGGWRRRGGFGAGDAGPGDPL